MSLLRYEFKKTKGKGTDVTVEAACTESDILAAICILIQNVYFKTPAWLRPTFRAALIEMLTEENSMAWNLNQTAVGTIVDASALFGNPLTEAGDD